MCNVCCQDHGPDSAHIDSCLCAAPETFAAMRRIEADLRRREFLGGAAAVTGMFAGFGLQPKMLRAQPAGRAMLLSNLRFYDGVTPRMQSGRDIVVRNGVIEAIVGQGDGPEDAERIDCKGMSLIPGLIDAHWHATLAAVSMLAVATQEISWVHLMSGQEAGATLMRGFTTVRDTGGPAFGLKKAIDQGTVTGPRIFPSGAMISQTGGHGDFRLLQDLPGMPSDPATYFEKSGFAMVADGDSAVLRRAREQLMKGASQIKIMAGGGVSSLYDPLDTTQFLEEEMRMAVRAAEDWGTYVCAHVYTSKGIQRVLRAGIRSIEHGQLADLETIRMMRDHDAWWSIQPFLGDEDANPKSDPAQRAKQQEVAEGTVRAFEMGRAEGVKMAFGTDILFNPAGTASQGRQLAKLTRFMSPLEALNMATGAAGELLAMSGPRNPYSAPLGVIAPGALADMLVVDADPETSLDWLGSAETDIRLIMKGGRVYKDIL